MIDVSIIGQYIPNTVAKVAVATSGGSDSICLLFLAHDWCKANNIKLVAVIIDHKLRKNSTVEAKYVQDYIKEQGIDAVTLSWDSIKPASNLQNHARIARYEILTKYCNDNEIKYLLVAHNLQDQAETILLNIFRGTGVDGLCGMKLKTIKNGISIVRPLLKISKMEIYTYLEQNLLKWVEDPSNNDEKYTRIKIRNFLKSFSEKDMLIKRLFSLSENATRVKSHLMVAVNEAFSISVERNRLGYAILDIDVYVKQSEEIALRILKKLFQSYKNSVEPVRFSSIKRIHMKILSKTKVSCTLAGLKIRHKNEKLIFYREPAAVGCSKTISPKQTVLWDKRFEFTNSDDQEVVIQSIGKEGWLKLKKTLKEYPQLPFAEMYYTLPILKKNNNRNVLSIFNLLIK